MKKQGAKPSPNIHAARQEYEAAPEGEKPSAAALAARHGLNRSTIQRTAWFKRRPYRKEKQK